MNLRIFSQTLKMTLCYTTQSSAPQHQVTEEHITIIIAFLIYLFL